MSPTHLTPQPPSSPAEWDVYFDLRWRVLRNPWGQPRGSERDPLEDAAIHLLVTGDAGRALACGRLHLNSPTEAQVRYMAVDESVRGRGHGSAILAGLEAEAKRFGASRIVLNARDNAIRFYEKHGYTVVQEAETLFRAVRHVRMEKSIC